MFISSFNTENGKKNCLLLTVSQLVDPEQIRSRLNKKYSVKSMAAKMLKKLNGLQAAKEILQSSILVGYLPKNNFLPVLYPQTNTRCLSRAAQKRHSSTSSVKHGLAREKLGDIVHEYASSRAERTYVWGYAAVGALGNF